MKRLLLPLLLIAVAIFPSFAQGDVIPYSCDQAKADAAILIAQAQEALANDDIVTAHALISGARALLTPCLPDADAQAALSAVQAIEFQQGFGAQKGFWQVYFTQPTGSRDPADYTGGIDAALAQAINTVQNTLDIAAFEWNNPLLTRAVLAAHDRGVAVRMVVDDEHTIEDEDSTIEAIFDAGIPVIDDSRSALMHNKFMIMDGATVWTGSMNFTINGTYRNNNNLIRLDSPEAVAAYQAEFDEMFVDDQFGSSLSAVDGVTFTQDDTELQIIFSPEGDVVPTLIDYISSAESSVYFMTFSFTLDEVRDALLARANAGVTVSGLFELVGSETRFSELTPLFCAGLDVAQDGNPFILHHKVFIIDEAVVLTGSFNISASATESNDENMVIIRDADLAAQYLAEYERLYQERRIPDDLVCE